VFEDSPLLRLKFKESLSRTSHLPFWFRILGLAVCELMATSFDSEEARKPLLMQWNQEPWKID
jgi:hypothetical protein